MMYSEGLECTDPYLKAYIAHRSCQGRFVSLRDVLATVPKCLHLNAYKNQNIFYNHLIEGLSAMNHPYMRCGCHGRLRTFPSGRENACVTRCHASVTDRNQPP